MDLEKKTNDLAKKVGLTALGVSVAVMGYIGLKEAIPHYQVGTLHVDHENGIVFHDSDDNGVVSWTDMMYVADKTPLTEEQAYQMAETLYTIKNEQISAITDGTLYATYQGGLAKVNDTGRLQEQYFEPKTANRIIGQVIVDGEEIQLENKTK